MRDREYFPTCAGVTHSAIVTPSKPACKKPYVHCDRFVDYFVSPSTTVGRYRDALTSNYA